MTTPAPLASIPVHDAIEEWTAAALTDGLSADERRLFDDHLAGCARCRELFAEETAMSQTIQNAFENVRPLPGFERRLTAAFRQRRADGFGERLRMLAESLLRNPAGRVLGATACIMALIALGGGLTRELPQREAGVAPEAVAQFDASEFRQKALRGEDPRAGVFGGVPAAPELAPAIDSTGERGSEPVKQAETRARGLVQSATFHSPDAPLPAPRSATHTYALSLADGSTIPGPGSATITGAALNKSVPYPAALDQASVSVQAAAPAAGSAPAPAPAAPPAEPAPPPVPSGAPDNRKLIRNASVELEVASFDPAVDALGAAAVQVGGGYVATVDSSRLPNGKRRGFIVLKILPEHLDAFLARLHEIGEIKSQNISTEDVTKDYFDTDARLRNARRMEDRLLKILDDDKGKLTEILQVEKELGRVREDIEKMQGQLQLYDSLVRYATVTIDLYEKDLKQPARFLLRQTADLSLLSADVEKTYGEVRRAADDAHAQIESSELVRADDGHVTANLRLLLAADTADSVLAHLKTLARVENFKLTGERVAQNGDAADTAADAGAAKLERGPVTVNLSIAHDEQTHRRVELTLTAADPSAAFDKVRAAALAAAGEIVSSDFNRTHGGHGSGVLIFRLPANHETSLLDTVRALGRTSDLNIRRDDNAAPDADTSPVLLTLHFADEPVHRHIGLTLIAPDLDTAFDKARAAALAAGGEITDSSFSRPQGGHGSAMLNLLLPGQAEAAVLATVRSLGRSRDFNVERDTATSGDDLGNSRVALLINFADEEFPVQQTSIAVLCSQVDKRQAEVRQIAASAGAQVRSSSFEQNTDGSEAASLVFRLPLRAYPDFIARIKSLGEVKDLNVHRQDRPQPRPILAASASIENADAGAPAEVSLRLYSQGRLVSDESGMVATFRHTLAQGIGALMWSLRMIGVALAFLAPWAAAVLLVVWLSRLVARRRAASKTR
jgi:glycine cleavage system regulatory protein